MSASRRLTRPSLRPFPCALLLTACAAPPPVPPAAPAAKPETIAVAPAPAEPAPAPAPTSARPVHWGYTGDEGPTHWAELSPAYAACASGEAQSPIDIVTTKTASQPASWSVAYGKTALRIAHHEHVEDIVDNGHTIQVTVDEGSTLKTSKNEYSLLQFHFHTPSENTVNGKHYPLEMHLVHRAKDGSFAVVAVFFDKGKKNAQLEQLIEHFPEKKGDARHFADVSLDLQAHLPPRTKAHAFTGSFTTPPCTPDVEWLVLDAPVSASAAQLDAFAAKLQNNNRPLQPLNDRSIQTTTLSGSAK